jgi:hypothetical protein
VICVGIRSIRYFVLLPALPFGLIPLAGAQRSIGNITVGYTYLWADQGGGERSNLNGFFMRPAFNIVLNRALRPRDYDQRLYRVIAFSIITSAMGTMTLYPASLGCRPSFESSRFNIPFSSSIAL